MSRWTKPRSYSLKVPWPLAGCVGAGLGQRLSPSALRMCQMLSRLRWGRKWVMTNVRSSSAKLVTRRSMQTMARSSSVAFQGNWCGRAEWSRQSAAPRLRHLRMVSVDTGAVSIAYARQAIEDFDPASKGIAMEYLVGDHQNNPDIAIAADL